jgi:cytochrome c oxidase cbb3-type subunit 2
MPAYAYLFKSGVVEGPALLAYLDSLGSDTPLDRVDSNQHWRPRGEAMIAEPIQQRRLFAQWCAACHGTAGRGEGAAGVSLVTKPHDPLRRPWAHVSAEADPENERLELARLIKFGLPGTAMAGHEYLTDDAVLSLAVYLQTVRAEK